MLIVGEVHTGLLRGRDPVSGDDARRLLALVAGEHVLMSDRPIAYGRSPDSPVGVDCPLAESGTAGPVRGVGTVLHRAAITGGHVVQGAAYATLVRAERGARRPWSHYVARPGRIETFGHPKWSDLAEALATPANPATALDLGALAGRAADRVQRAVAVSGPARLRLARTRLRWVTRIDPAESGCRPQVRFTVHPDRSRVLRLTVSDTAAAGLAAVCEDVALHDWLLTALTEVVGKAAIGVLGRAETLDRLLPAVDYLLHLWMPAAHGDELADQVWAVLERRGGFSRQWETLVQRIRDQLSAATVTALATAASR